MSAGACPVCSGPVERAWQGRPAVYCGKRCRQAAYRARLAAARLSEFRSRVAGELAQFVPRGGRGQERDLGVAPQRPAARPVHVTCGFVRENRPRMPATSDRTEVGERRAGVRKK